MLMAADELVLVEAPTGRDVASACDRSNAYEHSHRRTFTFSPSEDRPSNIGYSGGRLAASVRTTAPILNAG